MQFNFLQSIYTNGNFEINICEVVVNLFDNPTGMDQEITGENGKIKIHSK